MEQVVRSFAAAVDRNLIILQNGEGSGGALVWDSVASKDDRNQRDAMLMSYQHNVRAATKEFKFYFVAGLRVCQLLLSP